MNGLNNRQQPLPPPPAGYYPIPQQQLIPATQQQHVQIQPPPQQMHGFQPKPSLKKTPAPVHQQQQRVATGQRVTKRSVKKSKVSNS